jgi:signal transduction histidine kinase
VLTALVQTLGTTVAAAGNAARLGIWGYVLLAVSGLALSDRHKTPRSTFAFVAALTLTYQALHYPAGPTFVAFFLAANACMRAGEHGFVWFVSGVWFAAWIPLTHATVSRSVTVAAWAIGLGLASEFIVYAFPQMRQMMREQQRLFEERNRRQISEERLRIAHELHDVLGHHLSLINIQAGVGLHLRDRDPEAAWAALDTIKRTSAEALREVQAMLHTLRPGDEAAPRAPAPGLDRLDELIVGAGLPVRSRIVGVARPVPPEVDRAAFRIVQETLTNVRRHAGAAATAAVTIEYRPEELVIEVDDDGGGQTPLVVPAQVGNGINGMRERAKALGGLLSAGPLAQGGWRVRAQLPLPAAVDDGPGDTDGATETAGGRPGEGAP